MLYIREKASNTKTFFMKCFFAFVFLCILASGFPSRLYAQEGKWTAGFRTVGVWEQENALRLDVAIWYPSNRYPSRVEYGRHAFSVARNAKPAEGLFPIVLIVHGTGESRFRWHSLAGELAERGFIVVAPTFTGDNDYDMSNTMPPVQLFTKGQEAQAFLLWLQTYPDLQKNLDMSRIGLFGAGSGADAALLLAGASLDAGPWEGYCQRAQKVREDMQIDVLAEPYCQPWAREKMQDFVKSVQGGDFSYARLHVQALALAFPVYGMFFSQHSLQMVKAPTLMLGNSQDLVFLPSLHTEAIATLFPQAPSRYALTENDLPFVAGEHTQFFQEIMGVAKREDLAERKSNTFSVNQALVDFFVKHLM